MFAFQYSNTLALLVTLSVSLSTGVRHTACSSRSSPASSTWLCCQGSQGQCRTSLSRCAQVVAGLCSSTTLLYFGGLQARNHGLAAYPINFREKRKTLQYCFTDSKTCIPQGATARTRGHVKELVDYRWSPRWDAAEMARRLCASLVEALPSWKEGAVRAELGM